MIQKIASILGAMIGFPLGTLVKTWYILRDLPDFMVIVRNYKELAVIWQDLENASVRIFKNRKMDIEDTIKITDAFERIFKLGIIDLPFVDENQLSFTLHEINNELFRQMVQNNPDLMKKEVKNEE